jgi:hypothetical protein
MGDLPDGWSVDVDGPKIVVTLPVREESGRRILSRHEARVLRFQLHLAYLLAGRNFWTAGVGTDAVREQDASCPPASSRNRRHPTPVRRLPAESAA